VSVDAVEYVGPQHDDELLSSPEHTIADLRVKRTRRVTAEGARVDSCRSRPAVDAERRSESRKLCGDFFWFVST
jgi:hypothetical protein